MKRCLVTGGTGFLGSHIALLLTLKGYSVKILTRQDLWARQPNLKCIQGNLADERAIRRAMRDCDFVIHAGAMVNFNEEEAKEIWQTNYEGTKLIVKVAEDLGVKNFVFVSTAITKGMSDRTEFLTEENQISYPTGCAYIDSKILAEGAVKNSALKNWTIVYPVNCRMDVYIEKVLNSNFVLYPTGGNTLVDVEDVASGVIAAMEKGKKDDFILGGAYATYGEIFRKIAQVAKKRVFLIKVPRGFRKCIKKIVKDKEAFHSPKLVEQSFYYKYYSSEKAFKVLGWKAKADFTQIIAKGVMRYGEYHRSKQRVLRQGSPDL